MSGNEASKRVSKWYFGGLASAGAACCTHPLDLLKVHLQTAGKEKTSLFRSTANIVKNQGILALYNGLSASLLRQLTYSTTRFAIYDVAKQQVSPNGEPISFLQRVAMAATAGACGGIVGTPGDMINVRMQNDIKLPKEQRRNYKHALDGVIRVSREEGILKLFNGWNWASSRAVMVTVGQLCFYDVIKAYLLTTPYFKDNLTTHFTSSLGAGTIATMLTQPLDVLKTRAMNATPGEFKGPVDLITFTAKQGPMAFFKGFVPAFVRLGPHTILTFIFLEQIRQNFGVLPSQQSKK
eukprot:13117.XXX_67785_65349_1 [CDS] Oithona nana genome sequencing.